MERLQANCAQYLRRSLHAWDQGPRIQGRMLSE